MSVSSLSLFNAQRAAIARLQKEHRDALTELNTGQRADVGKALGRLTGSALQAHVNEDTYQKLLDSNKLITTRLKTADGSMETMATTAEKLKQQLINGTRDATAMKAVTDGAKSALQQMAGVLNTSIGGQYVFAGDNSNVAPMKDYGTDASSATRSAFNTFVQAAAGGDVKKVTAEQIKAYFSEDGYTDNGLPPVVHRFNDLVEGPKWSSNWSTASDGRVESSITMTETVTSSLSANEKAFKNLAAAYSMLQELPLNDFGDAALEQVKTAANERLAAGFDGLTRLRADTGTKLATVEAANDTLTRQKDLMASTYADLEEVDPAEATQRVTQLETQLEAAFTVTGRLQKLNILNYL